MSTGRRGQQRQVRFELPHALVTLTGMPDEMVEIEVWPKTGVSAFVVVDAETARGIADALRSLAPGPADPPPDHGSDAPALPDVDERDPGPPPGIIDLASRRRPPKGA